MNRHDRRAAAKRHEELVAAARHAAGFTARHVFDEWKAAHGFDQPGAMTTATRMLNDDGTFSAAMDDLEVCAVARGAAVSMTLNEGVRDLYVKCVASAAIGLGRGFINEAMAWLAARIAEGAPSCPVVADR